MSFSGSAGTLHVISASSNQSVLFTWDSLPFMEQEPKRSSNVLLCIKRVNSSGNVSRRFVYKCIQRPKLVQKGTLPHHYPQCLPTIFTLDASRNKCVQPPCAFEFSSKNFADFSSCKILQVKNPETVRPTRRTSFCLCIAG